MEAGKSQRWWEFYLVRYFVGTVFGMLIVMYLVLNEHSQIHKTLEKISEIQFTGSHLESIHLWIFGFIGLAYCYIASGPILLFHAIRGLFYKSIENPVPSTITKKSEVAKFKIYTFYKELSASRAKRIREETVKEEVKEYVESYKHLREHGNAFFIVLCELALGTILYFSAWWVMISFLIIWILSGASVWFIGTYLEQKVIEFSKETF